MLLFLLLIAYRGVDNTYYAIHQLTLSVIKIKIQHLQLVLPGDVLTTMLHYLIVIATFHCVHDDGLYSLDRKFALILFG